MRRRLALLLLVVFFALPVGATSVWNLGGGGGGISAGVLTILNVLQRDLDWDAPNPDLQTPSLYPAGWDRSAHLRAGAINLPQTKEYDFIHCITSFNYSDCSGTSADSQLMYGSKLQMEYSYDNAQNGGSELVEWNWDFYPNSATINWANVGATGTVAGGDNLTFDDGTICHVPGNQGGYTPNNIGAGGNVCTVDGLTRHPPANGAKVTGGCSVACSGGGTAPTVTSTSQLTGVNQWRPWAFQVNTANNEASLTLMMSGGGTRVALSASGTGFNGDSNVCFGCGDPTSTATSSQVKIPAQASPTNPGSNPNVVGSIAIDTSSAVTTGGELVFHDGTAARVLQPTETACSWYDTNTTTANVQMRFASQVPITVTAIGCANLTAAPAANPSITANTLSDSIPNAATHGQVDCVDLGVTMAYQAVSGANASFSAGEQMNFDIVQGTTTTDDVMVCIQYQATRQ